MECGVDWKRTNSFGFSVRRTHQLYDRTIYGSPTRIRIRSMALEAPYAVQLHHRAIFAHREGFKPPPLRLGLSMLSLHQRCIFCRQGWI